MLDPTTRDRYARKFGLPAEQIRAFDDLTAHEKEDVRRFFSLYHARTYVYAVKATGGLVVRRFKLDSNPL